MVDPDESGPGGDGPTGRPRAVIVAVAVVVMVATLVLCCVAVGQFGELIGVRLPPP